MTWGTFFFFFFYALRQCKGFCLATIAQVRNRFQFSPARQINPFTAVLAAPLLEKRPIVVQIFHSSHEHVNGLLPKCYRFVIGPSNILFASVYVCTFQPGKFPELGQLRVNRVQMPVVKKDTSVFCIVCTGLQLDLSTFCLLVGNKSLE